MAQIFVDEQEFNREVVRFLRKRLEDSGIENVNIVGGYDTDAPNNFLLRDFTFFKNKDGKWSLYCGAQEMDIIVYKEVIDKNNLFNNFIKTTGTGVRGNIIVPLVIMELKKATRRKSSKLSNFPSHDAISSNVIAGDVKRLFPKVRAMFLFDNFEGHSSPEESISFRRMLYNFDYICLNWGQEKENIWQEIKSRVRI